MLIWSCEDHIPINIHRVDTISLRLHLGEHIIYSIVILRPYIESVDMPVLREYPEKHSIYCIMV